jgi:hypothetical protein
MISCTNLEGASFSSIGRSFETRKQKMEEGSNDTKTKEQKIRKIKKKRKET